MIKRRRDSRFGLHFDFHATPGRAGKGIGATLKEEDIRTICREVRPDFLQIDCKGHPGWASYPTACPNAMPVFACDPLEIWRRVTREEGVALYLHYSGVIDEKYCADHPDQCAVLPDGEKSRQATRTNGRYVDELLIPQLLEVAGKYGADGVWVDGECWGCPADFHPDTVKAFEKETGVALNGRLPTSPEDKNYHAYREFCRELFRRYVRHYVDAVHERHPHFQIASNWAFSDYMPEPVWANVDFISGDLRPADSVDSARYAGRAIAQQGRTWDLMSWNFRWKVGNRGGTIVKHPIQIMQEAAAVISLGGGYQNYIPQYPDGSPRMEQILPMKEVGEFIRRRAPFCFRGAIIPQAAMLLSAWDRGRESESLYSRNGCERLMGLTGLMCDVGHSTSIVSEHTLEAYMAAGPVVVVPETHAALAPETVMALLAYAQNGGGLLLTGENTLSLFSRAGAPFSLSENSMENGAFTLDGKAFGLAYDARPLVFDEGESVALVSASARDAGLPMAAVLPYGKGKIAAVGVDLGQAYYDDAQYLHRHLLAALLNRLYTPMARLESAEGLVEITALEKEGRVYIQLVNGNGSHRAPNSASDDFIPPCRRIRLSIALDDRPRALLLQPDDRDLPFTWENGRAWVEVDEVKIHEIIEIVPEK